MELLNFSAIMDGVALVRLFCSLLQFKTWYYLFLGNFKDVLKKKDVMEG